jgi:hypothetical protein
MFKKCNLIFCFVSLILTGCAQKSPIYESHPSKEYEQPFGVAQAYQVKQVGVTEAVHKNNSDVVIVRDSQQYVFWDEKQALQQKDVKEKILKPDTKKQLAVFDSSELMNQEAKEEKKVTVNTPPSPVCKKIFCDKSKSYECGAIAWCDGDYCQKDKWLDKFYDCSGDDCIARFAEMNAMNPQDCTEDPLTLSPECLGKGDPICVDHGELFYCNNLAKECTK